MVSDGEAREIRGVHKVFGRSGTGIGLQFRLKTGSVGLFEDKKRCRMCDDERCVLCNSCEVEDVEHFLVRFEEFWWERQDLLQTIRQMEGIYKSG